jgi:hypothetical protein
MAPSRSSRSRRSEPAKPAEPKLTDPPLTYSGDPHTQVGPIRDKVTEAAAEGDHPGRAKGTDDVGDSPAPTNPVAADRQADRAAGRSTPEKDVERQAGPAESPYKGIKVNGRTQLGDNNGRTSAGTVGHKPSPYERSSTGLGRLGRIDRPAGVSIAEINDGRPEHLRVDEGGVQGGPAAVEDATTSPT